MKKYVYELYNLLGTVEHVGETVNPKCRLKCHKCKAGKFYGRQDIQMNVVKEFDNRKEAYVYQCQLQKHYGLKTDREIMSEAHKGRIISPEHKLKLSLAKKGKPSGREGKTHSDASKQKMSEARTGRIYKRKSNSSIT